MTSHRPDPRLARLMEIAGLLRDRQLAELSAVDARLAALDRHLAALVPALPDTQDLTEAAVAQRHAVWAEGQRRRIEAQRPPLVAARDEAADKARLALSRAEVLEKIAARARERARGQAS